jgi:DNA polymerase-1
MQKKNKTLIIDVSYLIYRSYFAYPNLSIDGNFVGAFFGFCKTVLNLKKEHNPDFIIFACDRPEPTWRHNIQTDYKAGRAPMEENMRSQIPLILDWCGEVSKNVYSVSGYEADDLIFTLTNQILLPAYTKNSEKDSDDLFGSNENYSSPEFPLPVYSSKNQKNQHEEVLIFSSDRDLYQLLVYPEVNFIISKPPQNRLSLFGQKHFEEKYSLNAVQWLDYKALVGDSSDNLKGVPGVGPKTATKILGECGSLYHLFGFLKLENKDFWIGSFYPNNENSLKKFVLENSKLIEKIRENFSQIKNTYLLATLKTVPETRERVNDFNLENSLKIFEKYKFSSLVKEIKNLQEPQLEAESLF